VLNFLQPLRRLLLCIVFNLAILLPLHGIAQAQAPATPPAAQTRHRQHHDVATFLGLGPPPDQAAAHKGEALFKQNCAACHGENARGGEGPNLVRSVVVLHDEKGESIGAVVKSGRPQGGMPAFPNLSQEQIYDIAEFLHQQVYLAANRGLYRQEYAGERSQSSGNAEKGKVFFATHCTSCHSASGDLAHIGTKFPEVDVMQASFLWPKSDKPVCATVTTPSGETVTGTVTKLDDFDVEIYDAAGNYHYWPRGQVKVRVQDPLAGHRALLPEYTDADIHNLAAYLLTLK
jgi:cytochrome c oxidase cbb3-type subunit 3